MAHKAGNTGLAPEGSLIPSTLRVESHRVRLEGELQLKRSSEASSSMKYTMKSEREKRRKRKRPMIPDQIVAMNHL